MSTEHERTRSTAHGSLAPHGARWSENSSRWVTLLVMGELDGQHVVDPIRQHSQKIVDVHNRRLSGHHVHVVDGNGFSSLLRGNPAPCLRLNRPSGSREIEVSQGLPVSSAAATDLFPSIFGAALAPRALPSHQAVELEVDLDGLDRGTAAHESTLVSLTRHLAMSGIRAAAPGPGMPRFDVGWRDWVDDDLVYVAEVKSLTDDSETQQIRLAIGQVLDYANSVRSSPVATSKRIQAVVVLERRPKEERWAAVTEGAGIILSWPPDFPGI